MTRSLDETARRLDSCGLEGVALLDHAFPLVLADEAEWFDWWVEQQKRQASSEKAGLAETRIEEV